MSDLEAVEAVDVVDETDLGDEFGLVDEKTAQGAAPAREHIRRALLREMLHGELRPTEDEPGSENWVAETHGGTRMPVRMALAVLAGEGLIQQRARHGFWIVEYRLEDIRHILEMRADVEARIVEDLAGEDGAPDDAAWQEALTAHGRMTGMIAIDDPQDSFADLDAAFHVALAAAGDFQIAARHIEEWSNQMRLFEVQNGADDGSWLTDQVNDRHTQLLEAIEDRKPEAAVLHVREELNLARRRVGVLAAVAGQEQVVPQSQWVVAEEEETASAERAEPAGA